MDPSIPLGGRDGGGRDGVGRGRERERGHGRSLDVVLHVDSMVKLIVLMFLLR